MVKEQSLSVLIKKADAVFSKYIRTKNSVGGFCYCFICSARLRIAEAQCGHWIDRDQMPTRYEEMNCHPVCHYCNCADPCHAEKYEYMMLEVYNLDDIVALKNKSRSLQKFMRHELVEIIETYKQKLKSLT